MKLVIFNCFEFENFIGLRDPQLPALLHEIEPILLLHVRIRVDLVLQVLRVLSESSFPLLIDLPLFELCLLLSLNDLHELFPLFSRLLLKGLLLEKELLFPGLFQVSQKALLLLVLELFDDSQLPLTVLKRSLGSQGINVRLSVGCLLLHFPKLLHFSFFLLTDSSFHFLPFHLSLLFLLDVAEYGFILLFLPQPLLFLHRE